DDDRKFLMYLRNKYHLKLYTTKDTVLLKSNSYKIDQIDSHKLGIDNIHIKDGNIHMLGNFISYFNEDNIQIKIIKNVSDNIINVYPAKQINYSQDIRKTKKYLSVDWRYNYNFELIVPLCENECEMMFQVTYDNGNVQRSFNPNVTYKKNTGLNYIHNFIQDNKVINLDKSTIKVSDSSKLIFIKNEIDNMRKIFKDKKEGYKDALLVRGIYLLTHPIMKNKKIWLLNDRLDSSDDNAKHLFDYIIKQEDNINKYYVIGKDCDDYKIMKKEYKNIVAYGSLKHKILFLYNQKIISSFLNFTYHNPFFKQEKDYRQLYGNLVNSSIYFLQHGVTARNANHFKRFSNELSLILATSDKEKEFIDDTFNYPKETTQTLGFPRYDNLTDDSKKEIIYMPTWRSYLDKNEEMFKNSNFFKSMNELLNDKKLLGLLDKHGYTLKFKPHPELLKYVELFDLSEDVKISTDEPYQQLFKEGSILISDFSSVLFDFAYLKKPIIYYQPHDDHQYEDSYFSYEDMGFGRVIKDKEKLVDVIAEYIRNDCKMEDVYVERVNSFYKYTDRNNCKRVYEWLKRN
ncbi:MAG: CDP-glycerol glycerophosphotransferase family protein, partial [Methanosphaera sp.]|nr:CDP-glycerol glycerophosphotransferase family protein [Methanosphaera sp.]